MKRTLSLLFAVLIVLAAVPLTAGAAGAAVYVSPDGSDSAEGSFAAPLKTLFSKKMSAASAQKKGLITNCVFTDPMFTDPLNFDYTFSDGGKAVSGYGFDALA